MAIAGGGTLLRQVIKLGLLDELELHIVPVILGDGMRLLGPELGLDSMEGSSSPQPVSSPPQTSRTSATASPAAARLSSTTEDETRNPPTPEQRVRASAALNAAAAPYDHAQRSGRNT